MLIHALLSLMPMFVALFWAILLLLNKKRNLPQVYLAVFLMLSCVNYMVHASFFLYEYELFAFLDNLWVFTSLAGYPLYYYYIRLLTRDPKINWKWCWILIPAFSLSLFSFILYFSMSQEELSIFIHQIMYHEGKDCDALPTLVRLQILRTELFKVVFIVQVLVVVVKSLKLIKHYEKRIKEFYSNMQGRDLSSFRTLLFAFLFASLVSILSSAIGKDYFIDKGYMLIFPSVLHSAFLYWIAYAGLRQQFTISDFNRDIKEYKRQKQQSKSSSKTKGSNLSQLLNKIVVEEKLFTKNDLKISDLSLRLNTNRSYISRVINKEMHTDFCTWINQHRIDYAQELLKTNSNLSLEEIAEKAGFSNLTTFYRVFKKHTNMTPGDYLRKQDD